MVRETNNSPCALSPIPPIYFFVWLFIEPGTKINYQNAKLILSDHQNYRETFAQELRIRLVRRTTQERPIIEKSNKKTINAKWVKILFHSYSAIEETEKLWLKNRNVQWQNDFEEIMRIGMMGRNEDLGNEMGKRGLREYEEEVSVFRFLSWIKGDLVFVKS